MANCLTIPLTLREMLQSHQPPPRNQKRGVAGHLLQFLLKYLIKYNLFSYIKF